VTWRPFLLIRPKYPGLDYTEERGFKARGILCLRLAACGLALASARRER